ncbi:hypothetical protein A3D11_04050 [Candidatus Peribacteria bacterium RIFCSPHIGHO2_02_FULL_49_16]|nr:MAG: hypothetical protein A2880_00140 [Candidatus Peribacteria bacterium RIFCSPHIGHO2_01_FULL_49_38]OGJ59171.1 MAG: hypothetical protein A3D11_04050 [Candidatus Peribacteria bacterium RIFCSPHIGHO2_02_FULL_49_16]
MLDQNDTLDRFPTQTLDEVRENVRSGEHVHIKKIVLPFDANGLSKMRALSSTEFLIFQNRNYVARLQEPSCLPLSDICQTLLAKYAKQSASLRTLSAQIHISTLDLRKKPITPIARFILNIREEVVRVILMKTEYEMLLIRATINEAFYNNYIHDRYPDDELYEKADAVICDALILQEKHLRDCANILNIPLQ